MTSKEALDRLKFIWDKETNIGLKSPKELDDFWGISKPLKVIEKLVERDTPKKVEIGTSEQFEFPICPNCKVELNEYYKYANKFCKECGQRIMWEKENDK